MAKTRQSYRFGDSIVNVQFGNIVQATEQVIVSSDDTQLSMRGKGIAASLRQAAGQTIYDDAQKQVPAKVGQVIVTSAGTLPNRHIFHAITREYGSPPMEDRALQTSIIEGATQQCLHLLRGMNLQSIAFPALGTGFARFEPADVAIAMAKVIVVDVARSKSPITVTIYLLPEAVVQDVGFRQFFNRFDASTGLVHRVVRDHAVVIIPGIRTDAAWVGRIEQVLKDGDHQLAPMAEGYGYFDLFAFSFPAKAYVMRWSPRSSAASKTC